MSPASSSEDISGQLSTLYGAYRHAAQDEPLANHVQKVSDEITRMLDRGDIALADLTDAVDGLACRTTDSETGRRVAAISQLALLAMRPHAWTSDRPWR
ncbi:MAG: hypothetical protein HN813_06350 [Rhodospirillaceae bacterium]|jgi:hypothetical protein|nr:hypothetical protein [Rhodospirillaceae bacterium]